MISPQDYETFATLHLTGGRSSSGAARALITRAVTNADQSIPYRLEINGEAYDIWDMRKAFESADFPRNGWEAAPVLAWYEKPVPEFGNLGSDQEAFDLAWQAFGAPTNMVLMFDRAHSGPSRLLAAIPREDIAKALGYTPTQQPEKATNILVISYDERIQPLLPPIERL